jgi:hypothetical protein
MGVDANDLMFLVVTLSLVAVVTAAVWWDGRRAADMEDGGRHAHGGDDVRVSL